MKRWNRMLTVLLIALMLCGISGAIAVAEPAPEVSREIEQPQIDLDEIELEIELEDGDAILDESLELTDDLSLEDLETVEFDPELATADSPSNKANVYGNEGDYEYNDSDSDFDIRDGVLYKYKGNGGDVVIPDGVTSIGNYAFYYCKSLTSVSIPNSITSIGDGAFVDCDSLTCVSIPNSVFSIGDSAFYGCDSLTSVSIPNSVTSIGDSAFCFCDSLTCVSIPNSVTNIGYKAFYLCEGLQSINVADDNPNYASKDGMLYTRDMKALITCPAGKTSVSIPTGVEIIEESAFCKSLKSITIPGTVKNIGEEMFRHCESLSSVTLAKGLITIKPLAFGNCESLKSITIPSTVKTIGGGAFYGCSKLTRVNVLAKEITIYDDDKELYYTFEGCPSSLTLYTVVGSKAAEWGRKYGCNVVENLLPLNGNTTQSLKSGNTLQIMLENATAKAYASSNKKVATVSSKGLVTAKAMGTAKITVKLTNGKKRVLTIKVPDPVALSATKLTIGAMDTVKLKLTNPSKLKVTWSSSNSNVVKITRSANGYANLKGVKTGTASITAKLAGGKTLKCKVTVTSPVTIKNEWPSEDDEDFDESDYYDYDYCLKFINNTGKKIVYVKFDIMQYNNRGEKLQSPYSYYSYNYDLLPHSYDYIGYDVNSETRKIKIKILEVTFSDKTTWKP